MTIQFNINYNTSFGEELLLNVIVPTEDGQEKTAVFGMSTADGCRWQYTLNNIDAAANPHIDYYFSLSNAGKELSREWITVTHRLDLNLGGATNIIVNNRWNEIPHDSYLYTSAYTDCINRHPRHSVGRSSYSRTVRLIVRAPQLRLGERLAIVGEHASMGEWNTDHALPMHEHNYNEWQIDLNANALGVPQPTKKGAEAVPMKGLEYKFIAVNTDGKVMWETCDNRTLKLDAMAAGDVCVIEEDQSFFAMCNRRLSGTLVPLFSLRTEGSFGVGDFGDLAAMVDFVADTGQRVLQLLPINDTTTTRRWTDSYPYSCISIFALNPIYVDLRQLPPLADAKQQAEFEALRQELNALPAVDYERVIRAKEQYMHLMYEQESERTMRSATFKKFFRDNEYWLVPYAQYSYLRDAYGTADFNTWPSHREWTEAERGQLSNPRTKAYKKLAFFYYVQFVLDQQMSAAHEHAMARGVILKGDIPIGVDRTGCDVWFEPHYFNLDGQAGAPPDAFSANGQNWGFPTYNWDRMLADGCQWWVRRFRNMAKYFDAYRIDHVLGFFRIWDIPADCVHALLGQFSPALPMTKAEIGSYGFEFDEERHTRPFINKWVLERIFGERALDVAEKYLQPVADDGTFSMRPEYDTERKVQAAFAGKNSAADTALRDGCDVWFEPHYFNLDGQAGAPPDAFSANGQNWGFPTYNWDRMLADGCQWWVRRFRNMAKYFDAYRIDHVLGFFRIWDIPADCVHALLGQFSPALPMTKAEIGSYGFEFDEERHTRPFINKWVLERIFGERALDVAEKYLQPVADDGTFSMALSPVCSAFSVCTSMLEVASSRIRMAGSESRVRANEMSCFCPWLSMEPRSLTSV